MNCNGFANVLGMCWTSVNGDAIELHIKPAEFLDLTRCFMQMRLRDQHAVSLPSAQH